MKRQATYILLAALLLGMQQACVSQSTQATSNDMHEIFSYSAKTIVLPSGQKIAYREEGEGEQSLLMIHGLGSYLPVWNKLFPALTSKYHCIAIDLPGYGQSGQPVDELSMGFFVEQIEAFIKAKKLKNLSLIGHSMGGQISIHIALNGKAELQHLILLAPAGIERFSEEEGALLKKLITPLSIQSLPDSQIEKNFAINFAANQLPEDAGFMYEDRLKMKADSAVYSDFSQVFTQSMTAMLEGPVFQRLGELKLPVLTLYGEMDYLIPNKYLHPELTTLGVGKQAESAIPNNKLTMIAACGHFVPWEQSEQVSTAILEFLSQTSD